MAKNNSEDSDQNPMALDIAGRSPISIIGEGEREHSAQRIQAALIIAQKFPRDELAAEQKIITACERIGLASKALYAYPKGGQSITGPSIRLAETLARYWGNLKYGFRQIEQKDDESTVEAFCWDLETNTEVTRTFSVKHRIKANNAIKRVTDPREIYELMANQAQRRVRATILEIIPGHIVEKAEQKVKETIKVGDKSMSMTDKIRLMVTAFAKLSVTKELLEKRLQHTVDLTTADEFVELQSIYNSMSSGETKRDQWFDAKSDVVGGGKAAEINAKFSKQPINPDAEDGAPQFKDY